MHAKDAIRLSGKHRDAFKTAYNARTVVYRARGDMKPLFGFIPNVGQISEPITTTFLPGYISSSYFDQMAVGCDGYTIVAVAMITTADPAQIFSAGKTSISTANGELFCAVDGILPRSTANTNMLTLRFWDVETNGNGSIRSLGMHVIMVRCTNQAYKPNGTITGHMRIYEMAILNKNGYQSTGPVQEAIIYNGAADLLRVGMRQQLNNLQGVRIGGFENVQLGLIQVFASGCGDFKGHMYNMAKDWAIPVPSP